MAQITATLVKELRERTGAPMMKCKKALTAAEGDIDKAIEAMRKSGQATADKKAGRVAAEGIIAVRLSDNQQIAVMLEVNSETDFVARDEHFKQFVESVSALALAKQPESITELLALPLSEGHTVEQSRAALVSKIGENIQLRRLAMIKSDQQVGSYVHAGRIGVIVEMNHADEALAKDIAMHIAASKPQVILPEQVPSELVEKEKEIFVAQAKDSGKPDNIIEKMIQGRLQKFLKEISLVGQPFIKDPSQTVGDLLQAASASVTRFECFVVGEGIEKQVSNFAEEVMSQVQSS